jgi:hypothetical protein
VDLGKRAELVPGSDVGLGFMLLAGSGVAAAAIALGVAWGMGWL